MGFLNIYKNNPTAGGSDGMKVATGNPILTPYLDLAAGASADIKLALRCDSGKKTLGQTTITPISPGTTLSAAVVAGSQEVVVASAAKLQANNLISIGSGDTKETVRIAALAGTTVTLASALANDQAAGAAVVSQSRFRISLANEANGSAGTFGTAGAALVLPYLATPLNVAASNITTGGSLVAGDYSYRVTAFNANGETLASVAAAVTVPSGTATNMVALSWDAVTGATGYKIYGRTAGAELLIGTATDVAFTDTGSVTPTGALPEISAVQISDKNRVIYARIQAVAAETTPYKDVSSSLQFSSLVGDA